MYRWAQQHRQAWKTTEDNQCGRWQKSFLGEENTLTTWKNILEMVVVSLLESMLKKHLRNVNTEGSQQGNIQQQEGQMRPSKKTSQKPHRFWNGILWVKEVRINCTRTCGDGKKQLMIQLPHHVINMVEAMWWEEHEWLPMDRAQCCLLIRLLMEVSRWTLRCRGLHSLLRNWLFFEAESVTWSQPNRAAF